MKVAGRVCVRLGLNGLTNGLAGFDFGGSRLRTFSDAGARKLWVQNAPPWFVSGGRLARQRVPRSSHDLTVQHLSLVPPARFQSLTCREVSHSGAAGSKSVLGSPGQKQGRENAVRAEPGRAGS